MTKEEAITEFNLFTKKGYTPSLLISSDGLDYRTIIGNIFLMAYLKDGYNKVNIIEGGVSLKEINHLLNADEIIYMKINKSILVSVKKNSFNSNNGIMVIENNAISCYVCFSDTFILINYFKDDLLKTLIYSYLDCEF